MANVFKNLWKKTKEVGAAGFDGENHDKVYRGTKGVLAYTLLGGVMGGIYFASDKILTIGQNAILGIGNTMGWGGNKVMDGGAMMGGDVLSSAAYAGTTIFLAIAGIAAGKHLYHGVKMKEGAYRNQERESNNTSKTIYGKVKNSIRETMTGFAKKGHQIVHDNTRGASLPLSIAALGAIGVYGDDAFRVLQALGPVSFSEIAQGAGNVMAGTAAIVGVSAATVAGGFGIAVMGRHMGEVLSDPERDGTTTRENKNKEQEEEKENTKQKVSVF